MHQKENKERLLWPSSHMEEKLVIGGK
ncbi:hypothetical protein Gotur_020306, partial [Gossypium turneri]